MARGLAVRTHVRTQWRWLDRLAWPHQRFSSSKGRLASSPPNENQPQRVFIERIELSDDQLLTLVIEADAALFAAGEDIKQRSFNVPREVMRRLGSVSFVLFGEGTPEVLSRIREQFSNIARAIWLLVAILACSCFETFSRASASRMPMDNKSA